MKLGVVVVAVLSLFAFVAPAAAGKRIAVAGITLEPPSGWKVTKQTDGGGSLVNPEGDIVWRFFATEPATDLKAWFDDAWGAVAGAHTKVDAGPAEDSPTKTGLSGRVGAGVMIDARGDSHILLVAAVSDGKRVVPMLIEFASAASLERNDQMIAASESIKLAATSAKPKTAFARGGWRYPISGTGAVSATAPSPAPVAAPATPAPAPAANLPFLGTWAAGSSASSADHSVHYGSRQSQYKFLPDGTYTFHAEVWGGTFASNWRYIIDEKGAWSASGDQLTITPKSASGVVRDLEGKVQKKAAPVPLEKATYRFQTTYFSGIQETQLVLTTATQTKRDGAFASNASFPSSYLLSNTYKPAFRFPP